MEMPRAGFVDARVWVRAHPQTLNGGGSGAASQQGDCDGGFGRSGCALAVAAMLEGAFSGDADSNGGDDACEGLGVTSVPLGAEGQQVVTGSAWFCC